MIHHILVLIRLRLTPESLDSAAVTHQVVQVQNELSLAIVSVLIY